MVIRCCLLCLCRFGFVVEVEVEVVVVVGFADSGTGPLGSFGLLDFCGLAESGICC